MHKPSKRELSILLTADCLDKIDIFMKFRHHIPYGPEVVAYKQHFAKDQALSTRTCTCTRTYSSTIFSAVLST